MNSDKIIESVKDKLSHMTYDEREKYLKDKGFVFRDESPYHYDDAYRNAIKHYGPDMQCIVAMEEMSELTKEISKSLRGQGNPDAVAEEIADVEIMIDQLKIIFKVAERVKEHKAHKIIRLLERIGVRYAE